MEQKISGAQLLGLLQCPAFHIRENVITELNPAAAAMTLCTGQSAEQLFHGHAQMLRVLTEQDCLYLQAVIGGENIGACAVNTGDGILVMLDSQQDDIAQQALALAARELRGALSGMQLSLDNLRKVSGTEKAAASMERSLNQMLRLVCNMSDAGSVPPQSRQEVLDLDGLLSELTEKAAASAESLGIDISYTVLGKPLLTLCDEELLERAVLNLISNSLKFTPAGGSISVKLSIVGHCAQIQVADTGSGIAQSLRSNLFRRYLRQSAVEDSRYGLGLGMVMVRSAAMAHGGTVLVDTPHGTGTRVTLTLAIRQNVSTLRSPIFRVDYSGEHDRVKLELSDVLPVESFL